MKSNWGIYILVFIFLWSCNGDKTTDSGQVQVSYKPVPDFVADSAYSYIQKQVDFGPRVPNTEPHKKTKDWFVQKFESFGMDVQTQDFQAKTYDNQLWNLTNVIASYNPSAKKRILINKRNRLQNRFYKSTVKTLIKLFLKP